MSKAGLVLALILSLLHQAHAHAHADGGTEPEVRIVQSAMYTLGGWSVLNITSSMVLRRDGQNRYFDQMNGMWNLVNLGIVGWSLNSEPPKSELAKKTFALNLGLDFGYLAFAAYLREKSKSEVVIQDRQRLAGYADSIAVQGAFLLIFDAAIWRWLEYPNGGGFWLLPYGRGAELIWEF